MRDEPAWRIAPNAHPAHRRHNVDRPPRHTAIVIVIPLIIWLCTRSAVFTEFITYSSN